MIVKEYSVFIGNTCLTNQHHGTPNKTYHHHLFLTFTVHHQPLKSTRRQCQACLEIREKETKMKFVNIVINSLAFVYYAIRFIYMPKSVVR